MTVPGLTRFVALPARARQPVENMDNSMRMRRTMFTSAGGVMTVWYLFSNLDSWSLEIICQPFVFVTTTQHSPLGQIVSVSHQVWFFAFLLSPPQACTGVVSSKVQISEVLSNWLGTTSCSRVRLSGRPIATWVWHEFRVSNHSHEREGSLHSCCMFWRFLKYNLTSVLSRNKELDFMRS